MPYFYDVLQFCFQVEISNYLSAAVCYLFLNSVHCLYCYLNIALGQPSSRFDSVIVGYHMCSYSRSIT
eukprot:UN11662